MSAATVSAADVADTPSILLGVLASSAALVIWIAYGLANAAVMRSPDAPDGLQWTGLQGIARRWEAFSCCRLPHSILRTQHPPWKPPASSHGRR
ncbi:hypothetical protein [Agrobacterium arsenijevicii]|uniref:hypothetical protein n=1 Tax=Agrobacterium arsenijevicii TaxID=1585697 RepID=UPI003306747E